MPEQHAIPHLTNPEPGLIRKIVYQVGVWSTAIGVPVFGTLTIAEIWKGDWSKITFPPVPIACILCLVTWRRMTRRPK